MGNTSFIVQRVGDNPDPVAKDGWCRDFQRGDILMDDGGPAFPRPGHYDQQFGWIESSSAGMPLRDWFAGLAMQAILASHRVDEIELCAENAYEIADAMLAQRAK